MTGQFTPSFQINSADIPHYLIEPGEKIELRVTGTNFLVSLFERLPSGASETGDQQVENYVLVYQYVSLSTNELIAHHALFIGGKPKVYFLYENTRYPACPVIELRLARIQKKLTLIPVHLNAENDPSRTCSKKSGQNQPSKSSLGGGVCDVPASK